MKIRQITAICYHFETQVEKPKPCSELCTMRGEITHVSPNTSEMFRIFFLSMGDKLGAPNL